jgi:hypothetical protein
VDGGLQGALESCTSGSALEGHDYASGGARPEVPARRRGMTRPVMAREQGGDGVGDGRRWRCLYRVRAQDGRRRRCAQVEEGVWRWLGHEWRAREWVSLVQE